MNAPDASRKLEHFRPTFIKLRAGQPLAVAFLSEFTVCRIPFGYLALAAQPNFTKISCSQVSEKIKVIWSQPIENATLKHISPPWLDLINFEA